MAEGPLIGHISGSTISYDEKLGIGRFEDPVAEGRADKAVCLPVPWICERHPASIVTHIVSGRNVAAIIHTLFPFTACNKSCEATGPHSRTSIFTAVYS